MTFADLRKVYVSIIDAPDHLVRDDGRPFTFEEYFKEPHLYKTIFPIEVSLWFVWSVLFYLKCQSEIQFNSIQFNSSLFNIKNNKNKQKQNDIEDINKLRRPTANIHFYLKFFLLFANSTVKRTSRN